MEPPRPGDRLGEAVSLCTWTWCSPGKKLVLPSFCQAFCGVQTGASTWWAGGEGPALAAQPVPAAASPGGLSGDLPRRPP